MSNEDGHHNERKEARMIQQPKPFAFYPNRGPLVGYALLYLTLGPLMTLFGLALLIGPISPPAGANTFQVIISIPLCVCGLFVCLLCPLTIYRLLVRKPSVIISHEGVFDGCSLIAGGMGLVRWPEILGIALYSPRERIAFIIIMPRRPEDVLARRGPLARIFARALNIFVPRAISLPQWLLPGRAADIYAEIIAEYSVLLDSENIFTYPSSGSVAR
jgi:hypothetical protein